MYIKIEDKEIQLTETEELFIFIGNNDIEYHVTDNNLASQNLPDVNEHALAVFTGKLFSKILGEYQPDYHLAILGKEDYRRASNILYEFEDFEVDEESPLHIRYKGESYSFEQIKNLIAVVLTGYFLGEIDWDNSNIGFVPDKNGQGIVAVRIDPGCSFQFDEAIFQLPLEKVLTDPFRIIMGGVNYMSLQEDPESSIADPYFSALFKDLTPEDVQLDDFPDDLLLDTLEYLDYQDSSLKSLLNKKEEINEVINKIVELTNEELLVLAFESGLTVEEAKKCIETLQIRQELFRPFYTEELKSNIKKRAHEEGALNEIIEPPLKKTNSQIKTTEKAGKTEEETYEPQRFFVVHPEDESKFPDAPEEYSGNKI
ncbi:hypothetical protein ACD661_15040 [Legionella lytica]|uniref:Uncharacterized protein n=1 Tax=Legionella lytica TaxID=96232 RepID=A0ABW8DDG7_9GAMM